MLQLPVKRLEQIGANITTKEIKGQPKLWRKVFNQYIEEKESIDSFLNGLIVKHDYIRVLFTGAGSSQYVGDTVEKSLFELGNTESFHFGSIGSTDIVSAPQSTLEKHTPTLLVSFARSGNSPESVATVNICNQYIKDCYHLVITCAKDGQLAGYAENMDSAFLILLPEESNDKGFAMTQSCSSMILMATLVFSIEDNVIKQLQVENAARVSEDIFKRETEVINYLGNEINRVVYVGSGPLAAITREAQLKILELTAGKVATVFDSSMGLRHGPKSFINGNTVVFVFCANNSYTRKYDLDLYHEVSEDNIAEHTVLIGQECLEGFDYKKVGTLKEAYLVFPALAFAQVISLNASILVGNTPDTPSASGTVNRVVKGVQIYPLERED